MYLKNINIVVMAPIPVFTGVKHVPHAVMCYKEWFRPTLPNDCKIFTENKEFLKERIVPITKGLKKIANKHDNLEIFDAFDQLCPNEICKNRTDNEFTFIDTNHIGFEAAERLSKNFYSFLESKNLLY